MDYNTHALHQHEAEQDLLTEKQERVDAWLDEMLSADEADLGEFLSDAIAGADDAVLRLALGALANPNVSAKVAERNANTVSRILIAKARAYAERVMA